jgi:hypothetical protein
MNKSTPRHPHHPGHHRNQSPHRPTLCLSHPSHSENLHPLQLGKRKLLL